MSEPLTPRTAAGRDLLAREDYNSRSFALITAEAIIAIEDEAATAARASAATPRRREVCTKYEHADDCPLAARFDPANG